MCLKAWSARDRADGQHGVAVQSPFKKAFVVAHQEDAILSGSGRMRSVCIIHNECRECDEVVVSGKVKGTRGIGWQPHLAPNVISGGETSQATMPRVALVESRACSPEHTYVQYIHIHTHPPILHIACSSCIEATPPNNVGKAQY
jgi:hypothetical protein